MQLLSTDSLFNACLFLFCLALLSCGTAGAADARPQPLRLKPGPYLFVDDYLIEERVNLTRTTHQPERWAQPILGPAEPWHQLVSPATVLYDPVQNRYRMWYMVKNWSGDGPFWAHAYAESTDGINWARPSLGLIQMHGSTDNNLYLGRGIGGLAVDEGPDFAPAGERFKYLYWHEGIWVGHSPVGIHWIDYTFEAVLPFYVADHPLFKQSVGDIVNCTKDTIRGGYLLIFKMYSVPEDNFSGKTQHHSSVGERRLVGQSRSLDFVRWTEPRRILLPDAQDEAITEFYGVTPYVRGELYLGFLRVLRDDLPADPDGPVEGIGHTEIVTSRDGENWQRHREVFFDRNHAPGTWDHAFGWIAAVAEVGDELYFQYQGRSAGHKVGGRAIGMAKLRKDGFVSLDAGDAGGFLRTPLVLLDGSRLSLNVNAAGGEVKVQVVDESGQAVPGFAFADCQPVSGDSVRKMVRWRRPLRVLQGQPVHLEFSLQQAELYSFELEP